MVNKVEGWYYQVTETVRHLLLAMENTKAVVMQLCTCCHCTSWPRGLALFLRLTLKECRRKHENWFAVVNGEVFSIRCDITEILCSIPEILALKFSEVNH